MDTASDLISTGISTLPALIVAVLIVAAVVANWSEFGALIRRVSKVSVGNIQMDFAADILEKAQKAKSDEPMTRGAANTLTEQMANRAAAMARTRILWVDDRPLNNTQERTYLRAGGATVVNVTSTAQAIEHLETDDFTLVITDMSRKESGTLVSDAGAQLAKSMRERRHLQPIIGYVGNIDLAKPLPAGWVGITNSPERLIELVLIHLG